MSCVIRFSTPHTAHRTQWRRFCLLSAVCCLLSGCGYTTRPGLASYLKTVYIKPIVNTIDITKLATGYERFPIYRHQMEVDITKAILNRFQFTGLLRPSTPERADSRLEGELIAFRRDALRYDASSQVEEWRLNVVANMRFYDQKNATLIWEEQNMIGDATYFASGTNAESEDSALTRAITDLAKRVVEQTVENW